jgi:hypothetical protein
MWQSKKLCDKNLKKYLINYIYSKLENEIGKFLNLKWWTDNWFLFQTWRQSVNDNFLFIATKDVVAIESFDRRATTYVVAIDLTKKKIWHKLPLAMH